jgi:transcriptional regulator with XRE-family HTH domain
MANMTTSVIDGAVKPPARKARDLRSRFYFKNLFQSLTASDGSGHRGKRFSQGELAELLGVSQTQISRYANGQRIPSDETQALLAERVLEQDPREFAKYIQAIDNGIISISEFGSGMTLTLPELIAATDALTNSELFDLALLCLKKLDTPLIKKFLSGEVAAMSDPKVSEAFTKFLEKHTEEGIKESLRLSDAQIASFKRGIIPDDLPEPTRGILLGAMRL